MKKIKFGFILGGIVSLFIAGSVLASHYDDSSTPPEACPYGVNVNGMCIDWLK
jgi:hypothetical protein